jgi:hypothetical protein
VALRGGEERIRRRAGVRGLNGLLILAGFKQPPYLGGVLSDGSSGEQENCDSNCFHG